MEETNKRNVSLYDALKDKNTRLSSGGAWLVVDDCFGEFVVYERERYARENKVVYRGYDAEKALNKLIN